MDQARASVRRAGPVGSVGATAVGNSVPVGALFGSNIALRGGVAPVRNYIEELLPDVWNGVVQPGRVFDLTLPLEEAAEAYAAMDERRAIKVLLQP